jgi:hypothetical protein
MNMTHSDFHPLMSSEIVRNRLKFPLPEIRVNHSVMDRPQFSPELELEARLLGQYRKQHPLQCNSAFFCVLEFNEAGDHIVPAMNFPRVTLTSLEDFMTVISIKKVPRSGFTTYEFMFREGCFDCFMFSGRTARILGSNVHITLGFDKNDYILVIPQTHIEHLEWIQLCQNKLRKLRERILCAEHEFKLRIVKGENHLNFTRYCYFEVEYSVNDGTKRNYSTTTDQRTIRIIENIVNELKKDARSVGLFNGHMSLSGDRYSITAETRTEYTGIPIAGPELTFQLSNPEAQFYVNLFIKHPDLIIYDRDDHSYPFNSLLLRGHFEFFETFMTTKIGDEARKELKTPYQSATVDLLHRLIYKKSIDYDHLDLSVLTEFYEMMDFLALRDEQLIRRVNSLLLELVYQKKILPGVQQIEDLLSLPFLQISTNEQGHCLSPFSIARKELQHIVDLIVYLC